MKHQDLPPPKPGGRISDPHRRTLPSGLVRWEISYPGADAKRVRLLFDTRAQADRARAELVTESHDAKTLGPEAARARRRRSITLEALSRLQLERGASKKSIAHDRQRWPAILAILGADTPITSIAASDVTRLRNALIARPSTPATSNRHVALLRSAFNIAVDERLIDRNPVSRGHALRETQRDRIATPDEIRRLLEAARPELRLAITLAIETVLRRGSLGALTWDSVDLDARTLTLPDSKNGTPIRVPLSRRATEALSAWPRTSEAIIPRHDDTITHWFADLCADLGISGLRFHDLRHTGATRLIDAGLDWQQVMRLGGWRSVQAFSRYRTVRVDALRDALDAID